MNPYIDTCFRWKLTQVSTQRSQGVRWVLKLQHPSVLTVNAVVGRTRAKLVFQSGVYRRCQYPDRSYWLYFLGRINKYIEWQHLDIISYIYLTCSSENYSARGSGFKNSDPDPTSIYVFDVKQNKYFFLAFSYQI